MNDILIYQVFEAITVVFEVFIVHQYISAFLERKRPKKAVALSYATFGTILMILSLSSKIMLISSLYTIIGIFILISALYKSGMASQIFFTGLFVIIAMASDVICSIIIEFLGGVDVSYMMTYGMPRVLFVTVAKIVQVFIVKLVGIIIKWRQDKKDDVELKRVALLFICQILSVLLTYKIVIVGLDDGHFGSTVFFAIVGILYINAMIFWYFDAIKAAYDYKVKNEAAELKLKLQTQYYELMESKQKETDSIRHDIRKHLNYINSLNENRLYDDAKRYSQELEAQFHSTTLTDVTSYLILNILLAVEKKKADEENINLSVNVNVYQDLKISNPELGIIIGNIFENAIEACRYITDINERKIKMDIYQQEDMLLIEMENTYLPSATLNPRAGRHGYGLKNIQKVVDKYGGHLEIKPLDDVFTVRVVLP